jgi:tetratricopeptide (TPR) repeat protein
MIEALLQAERLLVHGMVDQAERIYSNALEQDPLNAIAVVGLARVALERGDDQLAYTHARRALEIDPQNVAALRLEARLAEVLRIRQAGVEDQTAASPASQVAGSEVPPAASPDARPSEQHIFTRNPSMADHQAMEERRARSREEVE